MGLISKTAIMKWNSANKKIYESKQYLFTKMKDEFEVKVEDLTVGACSLVEVKCDCEDCKSPYLKPMQWKSYYKNVHEDGKYYCCPCANKLYSNESTRISRLKNSKSFKQWCVDNLPKKEADVVLSRWDYDLNVDIHGNKITPDDISFSSSGAYKKGLWFKCLEHPEHKSELQNIIGFTSGQKGSIFCKQCQLPAVTHPEIIKYFVNIEDAYDYNGGLSKEVQMICPNCGYVKKIRITDFIYKGFGCKRCGDGVSFPEKVMHSVLDQLSIDFKIQLSKSLLKWCKKYKYDFYIPSLNCIIETHGVQHYNKTFERIKSSKSVRSLKEEQENDRLKEKLAIANNIDSYIIIDCRESELDFIKDNILDSKLSKLFDLSNINWKKCGEYAYSSSVKEVCRLWNDEIENVPIIANRLKLGKTTVRRYLKRGTKLGWCNYVPIIGNQKRKVIVLCN